MKRLLTEELKKWKHSAARKPLLLLGARQVGKTWLLMDFAASHYKNKVYVRFDRNVRMKEVFETCNYEMDVILEQLQMLTDEKIIAIPEGDPTYNNYYDIHELPEHIFDEMMHFFEVYKSLEHDKKTTVKEICHRDEAMDIINKCVKKYKEIFDK